MQFQVLGSIVVTDEGAPVDVGGPRQRRLLAALLAHVNRVVSTDTLIEIVFQGDPPPGATTTIRTYVARLRKALGDRSGARIETATHGYSLQVAADRIDATRFESEVACGRRQLLEHDANAAVDTLRRALARWRGQAYEGFDTEHWVRGEVARLDELRVDAEEQLIDAQLACGLAHDVIPELCRLVDAHPWRERFRCQLMLALHRTGRHAEALRTFEDYRTELVEVGLEPSSELVALERAVAVHDPALQLTAPAGRALRGYRLGASLGSGRLGEVFRAVQPTVGREVAIKVVRADIADHPTFIRRFEARAQAVSQLEHAHIVPLHDFWREPNAAYLVMRLMPRNLQGAMEDGPLAVEQVSKMVEQLGSALAAAHRAGTVHGDIRPSNVLLDAEGNLYLSDFRIADLDVGGVDPAPTTGFEPPETHCWQRSEPASDQFALAVLVAYALTGVLPYGRRGIMSPNDQFPSVHGHRRSVPSAVDDVLWRATAWDPADRYDDIAAFADEFGAALGRRRRNRDHGEMRNPYRGLEPFTEADAAWFFGRAEIIDDVLRRLEERDLSMVTVIGASGSGKSSVVRAGVLPRLRQGAVSGSADWLIATMVAGAHPLTALAAAIQSIATTKHAGSVDGRSVAAIVGGAVPPEQPVLLVIDQLEELFTLASPAERDTFVDDLVTALADEHLRLRVLATLRADFSDRPLQHSGFGRLLADGAVPLVAMSVAELDQVIREPALRSGVDIEPGVVSELIADLVDQPSALPLLQFTLTQLFDRGAGRTMTSEAYRELGGVDAVVARRADAIHGELSPDEARLARQLFLRLVAVDEHDRATRRRVTKAELDELGHEGDTIDRLLDAFGGARLMSFDHDHTTREPTIELAHESLIVQWPRLHHWVIEAGEDLRMGRQITTAAKRWVDAGCDDGDLYRGSRLEAALAWADDHASSLTATEAEFLRASVTVRDQIEAARLAHLEQQTRSNRRLRRLVVVVGIALVVVIGAGLVALRQWQRADHHARRAETRELVAASTANIDTDPELSTLLAIAAIAQSDSETESEAVQALHLALLEHRITDSVPIGTQRPAVVAFSPDGASFATIGPDPLTVDIWSTGSRQPRLTLSGHSEPVTFLAYSPDGGHIATAGLDDDVVLWDATTGDEIERFWSPATSQIDFSADGSLVGASFLNRAAVWNQDTGEEIRFRPSEADNSTWQSSIALHPEGTMLATALNRELKGIASVILWDATGPEIAELTGHTADVTDIEFSPDGSRLYTASRDNSVRIWDVDEGVHIGTFIGHDAEVLSLDVSDDGGRIASAGTSDALLWDATSLEIQMRLTGHDGPIESIELSPDGTLALTGCSGDGTARLWSLADPTELMSTPGRPDDGNTPFAASALHFDAHGSTLTVARGNELTSWSVPDGRLILTLDRLGDSTSTLTASPDGSRIAAAGSSGTSIVELASGELTARPIVGTPAASVAFTTDGRHVISTGPGAKITDLATDAHRSLVSAWLWTSAVDVHPDGSEVALAHTSEMALSPSVAGADGVVEILDADTLATITTIELGPSSSGHNDQIVDLEYSPDGSRLATGSEDTSIILWDTADYSLVRRLAGHTSELTALAFDPSGTRLASSSVDGTVRVWDVATGQTTLTLPNHVPMSDVAFSSDGRYLAAVDPTGGATVYVLDVDELIALARTRVSRDLTAAECLLHLHTETCPAR